MCVVIYTISGTNRVESLEKMDQLPEEIQAEVEKLKHAALERSQATAEK